MTDHLLDLLSHPAPDARKQALELARSAGAAHIHGIFQALPRDARGTLWPPPGGWSPELLDLLLDYPPSGVRGLVLIDPDPEGADARLARVPAAFPALEHLDLSFSGVEALGPVASLPGLTSLSLRGCTRLLGLEPLAHLRRLRVLDLAETRVRDLAPLATLPDLQTVNLEGCVLADGLRSLPRTVTTLRLRAAILEDLLALAGRPLEHLSVGSVDWLPDPSTLPRLRTLALDRATPDEAAAWPVVRLWLREPADVDHLPLLRWLRIDGDVQGMALPDGLAIVEPATARDMPPPAWWAGRVCPPDILRHLFEEDDWAPLRAEADIFWRAEGFRTRLLLLEPPTQGLAALTHALRTRFGGGLMDRVRQIDALQGGRLAWLTEVQAAHLQGQLQAVGLPTVRLPM